MKGTIRFSVQMELFQDEVEQFFSNAAELDMTVDDYINFAARKFDVDNWRSIKANRPKRYNLFAVSGG